MLGGYSIVQLLIMVVVIAACVALVTVFLRKAGVAIPDWLVQVFWIVVAAFVVIAAIRIVAGM